MKTNRWFAVMLAAGVLLFVTVPRSDAGSFQLSIFFPVRHAPPPPPPKKVWVPGYYETKTEKVWVPGSCETVWVPPTYRYVWKGPHKARVVSTPGRYETIQHPGRWEYRQVRVWVSGRWEYADACAVPGRDRASRHF
jgi:hypothetical protein